MIIYKFELDNQANILSSSIEVKMNKSNFSLISNPNKRIPLNAVEKVNPEDMTLYLLTCDSQKASHLFADTLTKQASAYIHTGKVLLKNVERILTHETTN